MNKSEQINELATALAKAQGELENAAKSSNNPHFKSKYADLAEILNTVRPVFSANGLSVSQCPSFEAGIVSVETVLMHSSGQWMSSVISAPVSKQDAQGVGSAITYCRRYSLAAVAGIAQEDDDANSAVGHSPRHQSNQVQEEPKVDHDWIGYIANISKATDMESLKRAYGGAYRIAEAENNAKMIARLDAAKDKRKAELAKLENVA